MYSRELFIVMYNTLEATIIYESALGLLGKLVPARLCWNFFHASCVSLLYIWFKQNIHDNLVSEVTLQVLREASESPMSFRILIKICHYKQNKVVILLKVKYLIVTRCPSFQDLLVLWEGLDTYLKDLFVK